MARRTGMPTIYKVAKEMCRLVTIFSPVIQRLYPTNTTLLAALATANAACATLVSELTEAIEVGV